jgi:hypothetical protein
MNWPIPIPTSEKLPRNVERSYSPFHWEAGILRFPALIAGVLVLTLYATPSAGAVVFGNPITDTNPSASNPYTNGQIVDSHVTASGIGRGAGVCAQTSANQYAASLWATTGALDVANNDYFEWTLTPHSGYEIDFSSFVYTGVKTGVGSISTYSFRSSQDSYGTSIGAASTSATISLTAAAFQNITSPITFRLYAGGGNVTGFNVFAINDFTFNGTVNAVPEVSPL